MVERHGRGYETRIDFFLFHNESKTDHLQGINMPAPKSRRRTLLVLNRAQLAWNVRQVVAKYGGYTTRRGVRRPNTLNASRLINISQGQLWRLLNKRVGVIRLSTLNTLLQLIPRVDRAAFASAFITKKTYGIVKAYQAWSMDAREHLIMGVGSGWQRTSNGIVRSPRQSRKVRLASRQRQFKSLHKELRAMLPNSYKEFIEKMQTQTIEVNRIQLALDRIVAPLLDLDESGFMERDWRTVRRRELRAFFRAGMKRELFLLPRTRQGPLAQEIAIGL
jgi:hypothetical protein